MSACKNNRGEIIVVKYSIILLFFSSTCFAENNRYWESEVPVFGEASSISSEKHVKFFTVAKRYNVELTDVIEIHDFYDTFFKKTGWGKLSGDVRLSDSMLKDKWRGFKADYNAKELPEITLIAVWKAKNIPAIASVEVILFAYTKGKYSAKVKVVLRPKINTSPLFKLHELLAKDPKNLFILQEAVGSNVFQFEKIGPLDKNKYKNNQLVMDYYKIINEIYKQYEEFGSKYNNKQSGSEHR